MPAREYLKLPHGRLDWRKSFYAAGPGLMIGLLAALLCWTGCSQRKTRKPETVNNNAGQSESLTSKVGEASDKLGGASDDLAAISWRPSEHTSSLPPFTHGVASGDPGLNSVVIWTRILPADSARVRFVWRLSTDPAFKTWLKKGAAYAGPESDWCFTQKVSQLNPGTTYYYRFEYSGDTSVIGRTRTLPENPDQIRIGVVNCAKYTGGYYNAYHALAAMDDIDVVIHLGDYIYESGATTESSSYWPMLQATGRQHDPVYRLRSLNDYRRRYRQYHADTALQQLHASFPMINIWDDHDIPIKPLKKDVNGLPETEATFLERRRNAVQVAHEWLPLTPGLGDQLYRSFPFGEVAHLLMVDPRVCCRDQAAKSKAELIANPNRRNIGEAQLNWLTTEMLNSPASWNIWGNPILFASKGAGLERWNGYPKDKNAVLEFMRRHPEERILINTGNAHSAHYYVVLDPKTGDTLAHEFLPGSISSNNTAEKMVDKPEKLAKQIAQREAMKNLLWYDMDKHGFIVLTLTREQAVAEWYFVSTKLSTDYKLEKAYAVTLKK